MSKVETHLKHVSDWCASRRGSKIAILKHINANTQRPVSQPQLSRWLSQNPKRQTVPDADNYVLLIEAFNHVASTWEQK